MNTHAEKNLENKSQFVASQVFQKRSASAPTFQFVDKRPEAIAQRKLQEMENNSPQVRQLRDFQEMANKNSQTKHAAQLLAMAHSHYASPFQKQSIEKDEELQLKQETVQKKEYKTGLPDNLKIDMEILSGVSLDDVKVHRNSDKPAQLQAHAYAQGTDIHLGAGQEKHLPHEEWHVVQQKQGRVKPTMQMKGKVNVHDYIALEKETDTMGAKIMQNSAFASAMQGSEVSQLKTSSGTLIKPPIQRIIRKGGRNAVYLLLNKIQKWKHFVDSGSKSSKKYIEALNAVLITLNDWESGFNPEDIAEALRVSDFSPAGIEKAKAIIVREIEERIDKEVLSGGHSGEKHYGKDEAYQKERMAKEGKARVTTIDDSRAAQKFFTIIKENACADLLGVLNDIIFDLGQEFEHSTPAVGTVKAKTKGYVGAVSAFKNYSITMETISVKGGGAGTVNVTFKPKIESSDFFGKTVYSVDGGMEEWETIVLYWGGNSPTIAVREGVSYSEYYDLLEISIIGPVTAF